MNELKTERLLLRSFRETDLEDLYELLSQRRDDEWPRGKGPDREERTP